MVDKISVKIKRLNPEFDDIPLPSYSTEGSSGMDIRAAVAEDMFINPGEVVLVPTNLSVEIPGGYEIQIRPRSGLAIKNGIGLLNSPGTIDSDYRGEIKVIMMNFSKEKFKISRGDRIAQLILAKFYTANFIESDDLQDSRRGEGGFGHTGKK
jgi:dUTP pyrophosphatase